MNAKFISVEGCEGAGKTTQIARITHFLQLQRIQHISIREPGGTDVGEQLRSIVLEQDISPESELLLMFASRAELLQRVIEPALANNEWVVCDRFVDASYAYQGGGRGLPYEYIHSLEKMILGNRLPDLTLMLDVPVEITKERIRTRGKLDRFEKQDEAFFTRVRNAFLQRAHACEGRITLIDASKNVDEVWSNIEKQLSTLLAVSE